MIRGTPPPFLHGDSAGGRAVALLRTKEGFCGRRRGTGLHGARREQRAAEPPRVAAHDRADADEVQADRPAGRLREVRAFQKQRAEALRLCRASRGCNDGVLAVDGL